MNLNAFCLLHMELVSEWRTPSRLEYGVEILRNLWIEQYKPEPVVIEDSLYDIERIARRLYELQLVQKRSCTPVLITL